jgi:hypothetical protein
MTSEQLNSAIRAIKSGDKATGSQLLAGIIREDPANEVAWVWLATCVDDPEKKRFCLKKAMAINPTNQTYKKALERLSISPPALATDIHTSDFTQPTLSEYIPMSSEEPARITPLTTKSNSLSIEFTSPDPVVFKRGNGIITLAIILGLVVLAWILLRHKGNHNSIR